MKGIVIFVVSTLISLTGFCQKYHPFPKDNATWSDVEYIYYAIGPKSYDCSTWHYGLKGDTVIDSVRYSKLYSITPKYEVIDPLKFSLLREDSSKKIWHRYNPTDTSEHLLFDFGLQLGDSFCINQHSCFEVVMIDSVMISGQYRRRINFDCSWEDMAWIEGIGSIQGLFSYSCGTNFFRLLSCFRENNNTIYPHPAAGIACHCDTYNGINKVSGQYWKKVKAYPNPFDDQLTVELSNDLGENISIQVISSNGKLIHSSEFSGNNQILDLSDLESGLYLVKIQAKNWTVTRRVTKVLP